MSTGTRGERPASGSGTLWGEKPADNVSVGSSRTSQRATPATYADEKRLGAAETCNMSSIRTGETAETPEPKWYGGCPGGSIISQGLFLRPPGREHAATGY